eukprot:CAMPEP_0117081570 /NCGR_PEP_ID=MMETSP0472-20121206/57473_1 /TAXON_ID=693140 ORGANISM="Tiarina fusus, Strain LIS" /NCGR_SAMPLE_ID=MMETSP0472 /ASSEMBLY_ACC=CAM_ASM_000603 /LENGTH=239 /DNA_ID=CAMNT_0004809517 /DNA_START=131 /DNA_END=850 /DNA_ORIENTATION=+
MARRMTSSRRHIHATATMQSPPFILSGRREEREKDISLPRISLQLPSSSSVRSFSAAATDEKDGTFRERMEGRKEQGLLAMANAGELAKRYGPVFVGTYFSIYFGTLGLLFAGIETGALDPAYVLSWVSEDANEAKSTVQIITDFLEHYTLTKPMAPFVERNPGVANLAVAWIATKFTEPIRLVLAAAVVPKVARTLGYSGAKEEGGVEEEGAVGDDSTVEKEENTSQSTEEETKKPSL